MDPNRFAGTKYLEQLGYSRISVGKVKVPSFKSFCRYMDLPLNDGFSYIPSIAKNFDNMTNLCLFPSS